MGRSQLLIEFDLCEISVIVVARDAKLIQSLASVLVGLQNYCTEYMSLLTPWRR
jgi:hypothetical protein